MAHIAVVVGHHPADEGARSIDDVGEYTYNTKVADHLEADLRARGYRTSRVERPAPLALTALAALVNETGADFCVELHFNAFEPSAHGSEMLYWHTSEVGKQLARHLQDAVVGAFGVRDRRLLPVYRGMNGATLLRLTRMPTIITEPFFGSNASDWGRMKDAHRELAAAYASGIHAFAEARGIAPAEPTVTSTAHPPLVKAVVDAWSTTAPDPQAQETLGQSWPALAEAIRRLAAQA